MRRISHGDNLKELLGYEAGCAQLVYLDPPFNSGRTFEVNLTGDQEGNRAAFVDSWRWDDDAENCLAALDHSTDSPTAERVRGFIRSLGRSSISAYLAMMAPRLCAANRALASEGSLYLHCDTSASHYLKILLDLIFDGGFRNEIVWKRTHAHSSSRRFGPVHDVILFYTKTDRYVWNQGFAPYDQGYIDRYFTKEDQRGRYQLITCTGPGDRTGTRAHYEWNGKYPPRGRHWAWTKDRMNELAADGRIVISKTGVPRLKRYTSDGKGVRLQDMWTDVGPLGAHSSERTGYETQKPVALLERIVYASSEPGALVLDPFGGSGTTAVAAERLGRSWAVIDQSLTACAIALARTRQVSDLGARIELVHFPSTPSRATQLRVSDPLAYSAWAAAMTGTVLSKRRSSEGLATGEGEFRTDGVHERRVSFAPLRQEPPPQFHPGVVDVSDRVFVLGPESSRRPIQRQLSAIGVQAEVVPLSDCTSEEARRSGLARAAA